jgi:rod shape-determining protein MreC
MSVMQNRLGMSANIRFSLVGMLSLVLILLDSRFNLFKDVRYHIESYLTPVYYIADAPVSLVSSANERLRSYQEIADENRLLKYQLSEIRVELLRYDSVIHDNEELRRLNNSPIKESFRRMGAEVMRVDTNPFSLTVMINRGAKDGAYEGQPVINEQGIVGQIISVANSTSRVLLISDQNHSIPVVVMRNGIRAIATGTGIVNELNVVNMPRNVDIQVGDLLISSGLGGIFPSGYPVARVTNFDRKEGLQFAEIKAQPLATLDRLKYMLLLWLPDSEQETIEEIKAVSSNTEETMQNVKEKTIQKSIPTQNDKSLVVDKSSKNSGNTKTDNKVKSTGGSNDH